MVCFQEVRRIKRELDQKFTDQVYRGTVHCSLNNFKSNVLKSVKTTVEYHVTSAIVQRTCEVHCGNNCRCV